MMFIFIKFKFYMLLKRNILIFKFEISIFPKKTIEQQNMYSRSLRRLLL